MNIDVGNEIELGSSSNALLNLLDSADIEPGAMAGYEICKMIYLFHPLGGKMVDRPIKMAMNTPRLATIENTYALQNELREAFEKEWKELKASAHIANGARVSRIYGVGSIAMLVDGGAEDSASALDLLTLYKKTVSFNVIDPLSTAGSILMTQDPNSPDFQAIHGITVSGKAYHKSRCVVLQNEDPIYLAFNPAGFGYSGRSVYQRALYPLKSFIQTMRTDDMVAVKAGLLVTKVEQASSIVNKAMKRLAGIKNSMLKRGRTGEVLQIGKDDTIESIDLQNLDKPLSTARQNILENVAASADMPAIILNSETFAKGFGEGSEDAKAVASYIDDVREWLETAYDFFIKICQYRAWNPDFFETLKNKYGDELVGEYSQNFTGWVNNFKFEWDESLKQPESEKVKVAKTKFEAIESTFTILAEKIKGDPENLAALIEWVVENVNDSEDLFPQRLNLDYDSLVASLKAKPLGDDDEEEEEETEIYV